MSVFIPIPKKGNPRECSKYCTIALISHTIKVMFKILQIGLLTMFNNLTKMFKFSLLLGMIQNTRKGG